MDSTTATAAPRPRTPGPLINRDFALLWGGQAVSVIGDFVFTTTLVLWVATLTAGQRWSPLAVSAVLLAAGVPIALLGPVAGVFVDRWDKRRTMLGTDALRAALVGALILATGIVPLPFLPDGRIPLAGKLGLVYAAVFVVNAADRFFRPAQLALVGDLVAPAYRPRAMGLSQATSSLAVVIGPPLAAPLFVSFGPQWALLLDAASFVVSYLTILAIRAPAAVTSGAPGRRGSFARELGTGLRFFFRTPVLVALLLTAMIVMLGGGAMNALDYFFVTRNLHAVASLYGLMEGMQGIGMLLGAIAAAAFAQRLGLTRTIWGSLLALGLVILAYSRMTSFAPAIALILVGGVFQSTLNVGIGPLLLRVTPREMIGRVSSMLEPIVTIAAIAGTALAGYLDGVALQGFHATVLGMAFGPVDTIFGGAAALCLLGALFAWRTLREDTIPAGQPPAAEAPTREPAGAPI